MNVATTIRFLMAFAAVGGTGFAGLADTLRVPSEFPTIRAAIDAAVDGDVVLVADGRYTGPDNRNLDFHGKEITVRSENGAESCVIDCEGQTRGFTFQSGESPAAILSGFTIIRGIGGLRGGAILLSSSSSPTISHCILRENTAITGGGAVACLEASSPTIIGCLIADNDAGRYSGGGIFCVQGSSPRILDCTIERNSAGVGGGVYSDQGSPFISNCRIIGNSAWNGRSTYPGMGGGIFLGVHGSPRVENCLIQDNTSGSVGGGAYVHYYCSATFVNCTITGNSALDYGGGIDCTESVEVGIVNCIVWGNAAPFGPEISNGTAYEDGGTVSISYSDIRGGEEAVYMSPGAVLNWGPGNLDVAPGFAFADDVHLVTNSPCIDAGTNAPPGGLPPRGLDGNVRPIDGDGNGDALADIGAYEFNPQSPTIAVSAISFEFFAPQGGPDPAVQVLAVRNAGGGNFDWRPEESCLWLEVDSQPPETLLIRVDTAQLGHGDHVCQLSILAEAAVNRRVTIDITVHVNTTLIVPQEYANIQSAVDAAVDGDLILVADGVYTGAGNRDIDFRGKAITLRSTGGADNCTIDCDAGSNEHRGFYFGGQEAADTVLEGFTITRGNEYKGGAILCENRSSPTIRGCVLNDNRAVFGGGIACISYSNPAIVDSRFTGNRAESDGGGMFIGYGREAPSPKLDRCVISGNSAVDHGGGIFIGGENAVGSRTPTPLITRCTIFNNRADQGGGIFCAVSRPVFVDCVIDSNLADYRGGGLLCGNAALLVENCTFTNNTSIDGKGGGIFLQDAESRLITCLVAGNVAWRGGGLRIDRGETELMNCTIARNTAGQASGGGIEIGRTPSEVLVTNSIVWDNRPFSILGTPEIIYSDVDWSRAGRGNIRDDPRFVDPANADYRLAPGSPCIDAADNTAVPEGITTDLDGNPRFVDDPATPDCRWAPGTCGDPPIVDMGAFEFQGACDPCDMNCDEDINALDIEPFLDLLFNAATPCNTCTGDTNGDGSIDALDIQPFLGCLFP